MALKTIADLIDDTTDHLPSAAQEKLVRAANRVIRRIYAETTLPEMTTFTKNQILVQAGTAMLAQANMAPQQILSLLKG